MCIHLQLCPVQFQASIVGSVVECSPATRAARVRFPDDANLFFAKTNYRVGKEGLVRDLNPGPLAP